MSKENIILLDKASCKATAAGVQHMVMSIEDGNLQIRGSSSHVHALCSDNLLLSHLKSLIVESTVASDLSHSTNKIPEFDLLPCSPFSAQWKGGAKVRNILTAMLDKAGFKAAGRRKTLGNI